MMFGTTGRSALRALRTGLALAFALAVLCATAGAQYLFTDQQSGWVLAPKQFEVGGGFGTVGFSYGGESEHVWNVYGLNMGYGLVKNVELRVRYGYLDPQYGNGASAFSIGPKIGLWKNKLSIIVPVEFLTGQYVETSQSWNIQPGIIASFPVGKRVEITPSAKALIPVGSDPYNERDTLMAVNLGLGFFATADRSLVIRPEIGFLFKPGDSGSYMQFGIGVSYCTKAKS
jgi:hypothetical protein